ncbi:MAG: hypothetical protein GY877_12135 [Hyphomicrobium sp.]|nr:hypothetical protein [Hyphomicrobium sp.]
MNGRLTLQLGFALFDYEAKKKQAERKKFFGEMDRNGGWFSRQFRDLPLWCRVAKAAARHDIRI